MTGSRIFLAATLFAIAAYLSGCSTDTVAPDVKVSSKASKEFQFNYSFLYYYYYKAAEELEDSDTYLESPAIALVSEKYADVADILVMYASMSDPLTKYYTPFIPPSLRLSKNRIPRTSLLAWNSIRRFGSRPSFGSGRQPQRES